MNSDSLIADGEFFLAMFLKDMTHINNEQYKQHPRLTTAMIFAAGWGTRLKPWTDHHPKALAPVNGKPLLQHNIEYLKKFGITNIVINVHHFAGQVIEFLNAHQHFNCNIAISHEEHEPLETGGGLKAARQHLEQIQPFFVINADILTNLDIGAMFRYHQQYRPLVTLAVTSRNSSRRFLFTPEDRLCGWRNQATGQQRISFVCNNTADKAFSGIHIVDPAIFELISEEGKFSLVDLYLRLSTRHLIMGYDHSGDVLIDVGKPEAIEKAEVYFR